MNAIKKIVSDTAREEKSKTKTIKFILFYFVFSAVSELTFLVDDKRVGIGERKLTVCNEFSV